MEAFSILRIATNVGFATGPVVGGLMALLSYSSMFYLTAVTSTCYLILVLLFINDTRTCKREESPQPPVSTIVNDRPFMVFALLTFAVAIVYSQMYSPLSMYSGLVGLTEPEVGLLFAINGLMVVLAQYFVSLVTDRYRMTLSMGFGTLLYAIGFSLAAVSHNFLHAGGMYLHHHDGRTMLPAAADHPDGKPVHPVAAGAATSAFPG